MAIKLDERALDEAMRDRPAIDQPELGSLIEAYLTAVWLPIDGGAKTGEPVLLRRGSIIRTAVWAYPISGDDWEWWRDEASGTWILRDWPTHYAPPASLVDLEG